MYKPRTTTFWRLLAAIQSLLLTASASAAVGFGATIVVNTPNDEFGTVPGNCSLREAVQTANTNADFGGCTHTGNFATGPNADIVQLPAADPGYALARTGPEEDANDHGDLDILGNIIIEGAGAGTTPIFVCGGCADRVMDVISGSNVQLKDVTLKLGHPSGSGGGMFVVAGSVVTLTRVTIGLNTPGGSGGGIYNQGTLTINASAIGNNEVTRGTGGGAGIYNAAGAVLTLNDSRVLDNTATRNDTNGAQFGGGGVFSEQGASLVLNNSTVAGNVATSQSVLPSGASGGGILADGDFTLTQSTVSNNTSSGKDAEGGGIACLGDGAVGLIDHTLISGNTAATNPDLAGDSPSGGGIHCSSAQLTIVDSLIRNNISESGRGGGGLLLDGGVARIVNTTFSANRADDDLQGGGGQGGAISLRQFAVSLEMVNSTLSGNTAEGVGGGLFVQLGLAPDALRISLSNVTIAGNTGAAGGGLFISDDSGEVVLRNSVLSGNLDAGAGDNDDCEGALTSDGNNLVKNPTGCVITGITAGNQLGVDAKLGALLDNGGPLVGAANPSSTPEPLPTRQPANDSTLVDAAFSNGCKDQAGFLILSDQRGEPRPVDGPDANSTAICDIGAVEVQDTLFKNSFE